MFFSFVISVVVLLIVFKCILGRDVVGDGVVGGGGGTGPHLQARQAQLQDDAVRGGPDTIRRQRQKR